ncbi:MAG: hypothetical protein ACPGVS_10215 [Primorskyibacter sp.]
MTRIILTCAAVLGLAAGAASAAEYHCTLGDKGKNGNWLDRDIIIEHTGGKTATIYNDRIAQYYTGNRTTEAKVSRDDSKKLIVTWKVLVKGGTSASSLKQKYKMSYRASYTKSDGSYRMSAKPLGFGNNWYSSGTCDVK